MDIRKLFRSAAGAWSISGLAATLAVLTVAPAPASAANIVYNFDVSATTADPTGNPLQSDTLLGSLTTDGTIGVLGPSNILSWNLNLIDNLDPTNNFDLTPITSTLVEDTGAALSATPTALNFDYSGVGEFLIQGDTPGPFSGFHYFCFSTGGACLAGETIAPEFYASDGVVLTGGAAPIGTQPLGSAGGAPEAPTWAMLILGLGGLGAALRARRATAAVAGWAQR